MKRGRGIGSAFAETYSIVFLLATSPCGMKITFEKVFRSFHGPASHSANSVGSASKVAHVFPGRNPLCRVNGCNGVPREDSWQACRFSAPV